MAIITLADAKTHLNKVTDADDAELEGYLDTATAVVEHFVGSVEQRTVTDTYSGNGRADIVLRNGPVISVTSVTEDGAVLDSGAYAVTDSGILIRIVGGWRRGVNNIVVTYEAGRDPVPAHHKLAANIIVAHMWETQYNPSGGRPQIGELEQIGTFDPRLAYSIPRRALELLQPDTIPGI